MKTELTVEESQRLIDLGVDPKLASKCDVAMKIGAGVRGIIKRPDPKPIFTLTDILTILPKEIDGYNLTVKASPNMSDMFWHAKYDCYGSMLNLFVAPELIDALYQLLCWVITKPKNDN